MSEQRFRLRRRTRYFATSAMNRRKEDAFEPDFQAPRLISPFSQALFQAGAGLGVSRGRTRRS